MGLFLVTQNRVLNGLSNRVLHSFALAAYSTDLLCSATFASLACSVHGLAHSLCLFPCGIVEISEYVIMLKMQITGLTGKTRLTGKNALVVDSRITPNKNNARHESRNRRP